MKKIKNYTLVPDALYKRWNRHEVDILAFIARCYTGKTNVNPSIPYIGKHFRISKNTVRRHLVTIALGWQERDSLMLECYDDDQVEKIDRWMLAYLTKRDEFQGAELIRRGSQNGTRGSHNGRSKGPKLGGNDYMTTVVTTDVTKTDNNRLSIDCPFLEDSKPLPIGNSKLDRLDPTAIPSPDQGSRQTDSSKLHRDAVKVFDDKVAQVMTCCGHSQSVHKTDLWRNVTYCKKCTCESRPEPTTTVRDRYD